MAPVSFRWRSISVAKNGFPSVLSATNRASCGGASPSDGREVEAAQRHARHVVLAAQRAEHAGERMRPIELAFTVRGHDGEAGRTGRAHDVTEE